VRKILRALIAAPLLLLGPSILVAAMPGEMLDGSAWILAELPGETLLDDVAVTLSFEDGRIAGSDGCNRFKGAYTLEDDVLSFGEIATTMMACPEPVTQQARAFADALKAAHGVRLEDEGLLLVDSGNETVARFDPQLQHLASTRWVVTAYNNGKQAVVGVPADASLTLNFDDAATLGGSAGCNPFSGGYTTNEKEITVGNIATGRRACPEDVMAREAAYMKALGRSRTFRIEADRLELRDENGALQVVANGTGEPAP
jgi:heat shock protein HslJ